MSYALYLDVVQTLLVEARVNLGQDLMSALEGLKEWGAGAEDQPQTEEELNVKRRTAPQEPKAVTAARNREALSQFGDLMKGL